MSPSMTPKNFLRSVVLPCLYRTASMVRLGGGSPRSPDESPRRRSRQDHSSGCVSHPILQGRHPQGACLAVRFGDVPPSDGGRRARCRLSCLGDSRELLCQVFIDDGHGNAVTSRRHTTRVLCDGVLSPSAPRPVLP